MTKGYYTQLEYPAMGNSISCLSIKIQKQVCWYRIYSENLNYVSYLKR